MYNPKLNHMCLKINCLVFCEDTGACTMKLFVQYQLTVCSFFLFGGADKFATTISCTNDCNMVSIKHVTPSPPYECSTLL